MLLSIWNARNWRIKYQILALQIITALIGLILISLVIYLQQTLSFMIITQQSKEILLGKQLPKYTNSTMEQYRINIQRSFQGFSKVLSIAEELYTFEIENKIQYETRPEQRLNAQTYDGNLIQYGNTFTYGVFGKNDPDSEYTDMLSLTNILTESKLMLPTTNLYFTTTSEVQYYSIWPGDPYGSYVPHSRPWYQHHLAAMNDTVHVYTDPYASYFGGVYITQTTNLTSGNELRGVAAIDINVTQFQDVSKFINYIELSVVNKSGQFIATKHYPSGYHYVENIYNESLTGFNQQDFDAIYNYTYNLPYNNTCETLVGNLLCLVDSQEQKQMIATMKLPRTEYIIILQAQSSYYEKDLQDLLDSIEEEIKQATSFAIYCIFGQVCFCILIYMLTSILIQRPIDKLLMTTMKFVRNQHKKIQFFQSFQVADTIDQLNQSFFRIMQLQSQRNNDKNPGQIYYSQLQYPRTCFQIRPIVERLLCRIKYEYLTYRLIQETQNYNISRIFEIVKQVSRRNINK